MNIDLSTRLQHLLASSRGLDEPFFDAEMRITNWPDNFVNEVKQVHEAIYASANDVELRTCADILNASETSGAPAGLLRMLSRAVFDNPNMSLRGG